MERQKRETRPLKGAGQPVQSPVKLRFSSLCDANRLGVMSLEPYQRLLKDFHIHPCDPPLHIHVNGTHSHTQM